MKRLIAAVLPTLMIGFALPALAADSAMQQQPSAQTEQRQSGQRQLPADADKTQSAQSDAKKKHPPTSVMDRATPTEKASDDAGTKGKHPPTKVMGRATPDLKSPDSTSNGSQHSSESTSAGSASK